MLVFDVRERLDAPPEIAWKHLVDWENAHRWMPGVESLHAEGDSGVGTRLVFVTRGKERTSTITGFEPGRTVALESKQGSVAATYRYTIEPSASAGSEIRLSVALDVRGPLRLIAPVIKHAIRKSDQVQLTRFREWLEQRA